MFLADQCFTLLCEVICTSACEFTSLLHHRYIVNFSAVSAAAVFIGDRTMASTSLAGTAAVVEIQSMVAL